MDVLMERQEQGIDGVLVTHNQWNAAVHITSTVLVDDVIDVATTRAGIEERAATSNLFTGIRGTGGVFGAAKSFLLHYEPGKASYEDAVVLNDGKGNPQSVAVVGPAEGFKHLGVVQSSEDVWSRTLTKVWKQLQADAAALAKVQLDPGQQRYIVNHVWLPRIQYRTQLGSTIKIARHIDCLIRRVARQVLRLPHSLPVAVFHDQTQGLGLHRCVDACNSSRVQLALRVLNSPHVVAHHLLLEALEDYQIAAGLTDHPLAHPLEPPSHLQQWVHHTIRAAAKLGITTAVQWRTPPAAISTRPNDRSIWKALEDEVCRRLLRYNLKYERKLRYVGDIADATGKKLIQSRELARQQRWSRRQLQEFEELEVALLDALCEPESRRLIRPVGRLPYQTGHLRMPAIEIAPDGFFIVSQFNVGPDGLELTGHELGCRIGDTVSEDENGLGTVIEVQWWHTRGRDVWTLRPEGRMQEFADVCIPVSVTPLRGRRSHQVVIWNDVTVSGITGTEDRQAIADAFQRCRNRYDSVVRTGAVVQTDRSCRECHRQRGSQRCANCEEWHHHHCRVCPRAAPSPFGADWARCVEQPPRQVLHAAGDGSVRASGTASASGGWGLTNETTVRLGQLAVHWKDITSTRCECHALIAGLVASGDSGTQICDNKAAITILATARAMVRGQRLRHIKYSNRHRVELRSMMAHMKPGGTFTAVWVRSHQEHDATNDEILAAQRLALADADRLATRSHEQEATETYSQLLVWDSIHIVDERLRPVVGNTFEYLMSSAQTQAKLQWISQQRVKGPHRETADVSSLDTPRMMRWNAHETRFYWRAIGHALHTNAQKHRIHGQWSNKCRLCDQAAADTQEHRFGVGNEACTKTKRFHEEVREAWETACQLLWMPDQEHYLPGRAAEVARASGRPVRGLWKSTGREESTQQQMVQVKPGLWVHAILLQDLIVDGAFIEYASHLLTIEQEARSAYPAGRHLPRGLQQLVKACAPSAAHYAYHPSQVCDVWERGTLASAYPVFLPALAVQPPLQNHRCWWIDDTFAPADEREWQRRAEQHELVEEGSTIWLACYNDTAAHRFAERHAVEWYVHIPAGDLKMRSVKASSQTTELPRSGITTRNPKSIWIGIVTTSRNYAEHHAARAVWETALSEECGWLCNERRDPPRRGVGPRQATVLWFDEPVGGLEMASTTSRSWLKRTYPTVYAAPSGRQSFPSVTMDMVSWSRSMTHSTTAAKAWLRTIIRATWSATRAHWTRTCSANADAIAADGDDGLLTDVNDQIRAGRIAHQSAPTGLDRAMERHAALLERRTQEWHQARHEARTRADTARQEREDTGPDGEGAGEHGAAAAEDAVLADPGILAQAAH